MLLQEQLSFTSDFVEDRRFDVFARHIPASWVEEALCVTGTTTLRRRRIPMEQAVWLVLGAALMRNRSIVSVAEKLELALPGKSDFVVPSALSQARQRLGSDPLKWLFQTSASRWSRSDASHQWHGLNLVILDGVVFRTPDSAENRAAFGGQNCVDDKASPFPQIRAVCLLGARTRQIIDAEFDSFDVGECSLAERLLPSLPAQSLVLLDKGYFSAHLLLSIGRAGQHWLLPMHQKCRHEVIEVFGQGDERWRLPVSPQAQKKHPELPTFYEVRAATKTLPNGTQKTILTSLMSVETWPADDVFEVYRERWEIELAYREIKVDLLEASLTMRSQKPDGVEQEFWATLLMYNIVRLEMATIADEADVEPLRISFSMALRYIVDEMEWAHIVSPGAIPKNMIKLRKNIKRFILPKRRRHRTFPRVVVMPNSKFPKKNKNAAQLA